MQVNESDATRQVVIFGLSQGGIAGKIVGGLTGVLWPSSGDDVWSSIRDRVEALINQKLQAAEYRVVSDILAGLRNDLDLYKNYLPNAGTSKELIPQYTATRTNFQAALPHFRSRGSEVLLLPLFAQFANLHLALLRDGALHGTSWGMSDGDATVEKGLLANAIADYREYAPRIVAQGRSPNRSSVRGNWVAINSYERFMHLNVLDHWHNWDFFRLDAGPATHPTRTIYSDPIAGVTSDEIGFRDVAMDPITRVGAWGDAWVHGMSVEYGHVVVEEQRWDNGHASRSREVPVGPDGVSEVFGTIMRLIKRQSGGQHRDLCVSLSVKSPEGVPVFLGVPYGDNDEYFVDGRSNFTINYDSHILSTIHITTPGEGVMVFGFRLKDSYSGPRRQPVD